MYEFLGTGPSRGASALRVVAAERGRSRQHGGTGGRSVAPMLEVRDADLPLYQRLGFRVDSETATPDGAATMHPIHRVNGEAAGASRQEAASIARARRFNEVPDTFCHC